jgi:hypothetical protein
MKLPMEAPLSHLRERYKSAADQLLIAEIHLEFHPGSRDVRANWRKRLVEHFAAREDYIERMGFILLPEPIVECRGFDPDA